MKEQFFMAGWGDIWNREVVGDAKNPSCWFNNNQSSYEMKVLVYILRKNQEIASEKKSGPLQPLICYVICRKVMEGYVFVPYKLENTDDKTITKFSEFQPVTQIPIQDNSYKLTLAQNQHGCFQK